MRSTTTTIFLASILIVAGGLGVVFGALNVITEGIAADLEYRHFRFEISGWPLFLGSCLIGLIGLFTLIRTLIRRKTR